MNESHHFPAEVRMMLLRAAQTAVTKADPNARIRAINEAMEKCRRRFPKLFTDGKHETRGSK